MIKKILVSISGAILSFATLATSVAAQTNSSFETTSAEASLPVAIVQLGLAILVIVSLWKIFEKAGQPGWKAIIPIYNIYIMLKIAGRPGWWLILFFLPILPAFLIIFVPFLTQDPQSMALIAIVLIIIASIIALIIQFLFYQSLARSFGKGLGFTLGLLFLNVIFFPILAFGDAQYIGPAGAAGSIPPPPPPQPQYPQQTM